MIVMKFGGSSVANAKRIRNAAGIVRSRIDKNPIVVVSALGGVTDSLIEAANESVDGMGLKKVDGILERHYAAIEELGLNPEIIDAEVKQMRSSFDEINAERKLTQKMFDRIVSYGERMSARIMAACLSDMDIQARAYDAYDIGLITDSNFGDADVLPESYARMNKLVRKIKGTPVITGYIGKDKNGDITTLGRGGSDYTASIVGAAVGAEEIQIWTDVDGIMTADPKMVSTAKSIDIVSYGEATELAFLGAKVLHPKTILPAVEHNIPVRILNTFNPEYKGTLVLGNVNMKSRVASIAYKKQVQVVEISMPMIEQKNRFLQRILEIFENHKVPVDMITTSDVSASITIDGKYRTDALLNDLGKMAIVEVKSNMAKVSLVGHDLAQIPGVKERVSDSLKTVDVEMRSASKINQSFVVKENRAKSVIKKLHDAFFGR